MRIDREITKMEETIQKMGSKVIDMHENVIKALVERDTELELSIVRADERINLLEEEVNDQAVRALALLSPVASDLRRVITGIKVASELERIGDYAKNIASFLLKNEHIDSAALDYAIAMQKNSIEMLRQAMVCYDQKDVEMAFEIPEMDKEIERLFKEMRENIKQRNDIDEIRNLFDVITMFRNIEREGDHITNICEHVIYMVKGQHYDFG